MSWWGGAFLFVLAIVVIDALRPRPFDDTDDLKNQARSGVRLIVDHGTGCQYLTTFAGGITPRLGRDGKQVCA